MQKFEFHPFSDDYPLMPMPEIARMTERMERDGYDPRPDDGPDDGPDPLPRSGAAAGWGDAPAGDL